MKKKNTHNSNILKIEFVVRVKRKSWKKINVQNNIPDFVQDNNLDFEMKDIDGNSIGIFCKSQ